MLATTPRHRRLDDPERFLGDPEHVRVSCVIFVFKTERGHVYRDVMNVGQAKSDRTDLGDLVYYRFSHLEGRLLKAGRGDTRLDRPRERLDHFLPDAGGDRFKIAAVFSCSWKVFPGRIDRGREQSLVRFRQGRVPIPDKVCKGRLRRLQKGQVLDAACQLGHDYVSPASWQ